jgi:hypothetical protein
MVAWVLASVGPLMWLTGNFRARATARSLTQFGPLPEWPITWLDWAMLVAACVLVTRAGGRSSFGALGSLGKQARQFKACSTPTSATPW